MNELTANCPPEIAHDYAEEHGVRLGRDLILTIEHDHDTEMPSSGYDGWRLVSFSNRHINHEDPGNYAPPSIGIRRKLQVGLAFFLSYYEHGEGSWSLYGEGMQCRWDTTQFAGILLWTGKPRDIGARTREDRAQDARGFLGEYNDWMNGACYWFSLETPDGEDVDSCGGFIGWGHINDVLAAEFLKAGDRVQVQGEAAWLFEAPEGVEIVDSFDEEESA